MGRRRLDWNRLQQVMDQVRRKSDERCDQRWRPRVSLRPADSAPALLRLAGGCACGYRFRSNSRMGRNRHTGTCSVLLQFCANAVCSRWRTRRGKNLKLVRFVPHSTPDTATASRVELLQSGRSWTGDWNGTV